MLNRSNWVIRKTQLVPNYTQNEVMGWKGLTVCVVLWTPEGAATSISMSFSAAPLQERKEKGMLEAKGAASQISMTNSGTNYRPSVWSWVLVWTQRNQQWPRGGGWAHWSPLQHPWLLALPFLYAPAAELCKRTCYECQRVLQPQSVWLLWRSSHWTQRKWKAQISNSRLYCYKNVKDVHVEQWIHRYNVKQQKYEHIHKQSAVNNFLKENIWTSVLNKIHMMILIFRSNVRNH